MSIKRSAALQPLSRDHLVALLHSYRLSKAASGDPRFQLNDAIAGFKGAWQEEIAIHFADEERLFVSLSVSQQSLEKLFDDHAQIRALVLRLYFDGTAEQAALLGETLEKHIRWEEHDLFPEIEASLSGDELSHFEALTEKIELSRDRKHDASSKAE
jgi:hypothetical protein